MTRIKPDDWPVPFRVTPCRSCEISSYALKSVILQYKRDTQNNRRDTGTNAQYDINVNMK